MRIRLARMEHVMMWGTRRTYGASNPISIPGGLNVLLLLMVLASTFSPSLLPLQDVSAQGTPCMAISPSTEEYGVNVCLIDPTDGAILTGTAPMSATVGTLFGVPPGIREVGFYLYPQFVPPINPIATDFQLPFTLDLPTDRWVDGDYILEARVSFSDGFKAPIGPSAHVTLANGVFTAPGSDGSFTPRTSSASPLHVVAVGDGGGGLSGTYEVGSLASGLNPDLFFYLGDVYEAGTYTEFVNYYGPTLGSLNDRTNPIVGNHEVRDGYYGYMDYWNMGSRYYSFNAGGWHVVALDSSTSSLLRPGTAQYAWLESDLAANADTGCTMVLVHHPRFTLTDELGNPQLQDAWSLMDQYGVDLYLTGHDHNYQRWLPMNGAGEIDPAGITQIVVGTGGHKRHGFAYSDSRVAYRQSTDGVLSLTLTPDGASAQFIRTDGSIPDEISITCDSGTLPATPIPTVTSTPSPPPASSNILTPVADARVIAGEPTTNFGADTLLVADTSPEEHSYLRFEVPGDIDTVASAQLRLRVANGTGNAPAVAVGSSQDWDESTITWATKPDAGTPVADNGKVNRDTWLVYDVTSAVIPGQAVTFVLLPQSSDGLDVHSRENDVSIQPQLVIDTTSVTPTPEVTPSPTATVAPTPTPRPRDDNTLYPVADAIIVAANPDANFGTTDRLGADTSPQETSLLRFELPEGSGPFASAQLRLWVPPGSGNGTTNAPALALLDDAAWDETTVTWSSALVPGQVVADHGRANSGTWIEYDLASGLPASGPVSFALVPQSSDGVVIASRETTTPPELVLVPASGTPVGTPALEATLEVTPSPTTAPTMAPPAGSIFYPAADARVSAKTPDKNEGAADVLGADLSPEETSYLRFDTPAISGTVTKATLRLWIPAGSGNGTTNAPAIATVGDQTWSELELTWNTRPPAGATIDDRGRSNSGTWLEYDVTSALRAGGTVSFTFVAQSSDGVVFASQESDTPPHLVIELAEDGSFSQPVATPTAPNLASPSASPNTTTPPTPDLSPTATPTVEEIPEPTYTPTPEPTATATSSPEPTATATSTPEPTTAPLQETVIVATGDDRLRCRSAASLDATIIASLDPGSTVLVRGEQEGDWLPVSCAGQDGYVYAPLVVPGTPLPLDEVTNGTEETVAKPVAVTLDTPQVVQQAPEITQSIGTEVIVATEADAAGLLPIGTLNEPDTIDTDEAPASTDVASQSAPPEPTSVPVINGWQSPSAMAWWLLTDGDLQSVWSGEVPPDTGVIEIGLDLGYPVPVSHMRLQPTWPMQGLLEIQLSNDGVAWYSLTRLDLATQPADNWQTIEVHITTRYVRLMFHSAAGSIRELDVWAEPGGVAMDVSVLPLVTPAPPQQEEIVPTVAIPSTEEPPPAQPTLAAEEPPELLPPAIAEPPAQEPPPTEEPTIPAPSPTEEPTAPPPMESLPESSPEPDESG